MLHNLCRCDDEAEHTNGAVAESVRLTAYALIATKACTASDGAKLCGLRDKNCPPRPSHQFKDVGRVSTGVVSHRQPDHRHARASSVAGDDPFHVTLDVGLESVKPGDFRVQPVRSVATAHARKQAAPSTVVKLAAARLITDPVEGTRYPATAEMPKKTQPSRLTDGSHQPERPRAR